MNVLGLFGSGMNPGACLLRDGELVAFSEEERFTRIKAAPGLFPGRAVAYALAEGGLELGGVDRIAFAWDAGRYPYGMVKRLAGQFLKHRRRAGRGENGHERSSNVLTALENAFRYTPSRLRQEIRLGLRAQGLRGEIPPIEFVPHHLCHSYSAYFCSPYREAVVLTFDGSGEDVCTQVAIGRDDRLTVEDAIPLPHSLGWFYGAFTAYFGFTPYRHEGKLMALAGLGAERGDANPWSERLAQVLSVRGGRYEVDPIYTRFGGHSHSERFTDALVELVTGFDAGLEPIAPGAGSQNGAPSAPYLEPGYVDLAWGVQTRLEEATRALAEHCAAKHGIRDLCIAGGVGLNCKMNGALLRETSFERIFVQPASYDAGTAIGAAMVVAEAGGDPIRNEMRHARLGPGYSNGDVASVLDACGLAAAECGDVAARVARELAAGRIVGWFQGRMEAGPRALGARSILASPSEPEVVERLNRRVKSREAWRPFCPSILSGHEDDWFENGAEAPFMTTAFTVREERRGAMRAAMHVDHTARPQTVSEDASPLYHRLLREFHALTGIPFLINTSFNVDGEPIVCTPRDALRCFYSSGLDALALGDFLLTKA